jgi:hypothetical protein
MTDSIYYNFIGEKHIKIIISSFFISFSNINNINNNVFILKIPGETAFIDNYYDFIENMMIFYSLKMLFIKKKLDKNNNKYVKMIIKPINNKNTIYFCKNMYKKISDLMTLSIKLYFFDNIIDYQKIWWMSKDNMTFLPNKYYDKIYNKKFNNSLNIFIIPFTQTDFENFQLDNRYLLNNDQEIECKNYQLNNNYNEIEIKNNQLNNNYNEIKIKNNQLNNIYIQNYNYYNEIEFIKNMEIMKNELCQIIYNIIK